MALPTLLSSPITGRRVLRVRLIAFALLMSFLASLAAPLVEAVSSDPIARMMASQAWCRTGDGTVSAGSAAGTGSEDPGAPATHAASKHCPMCGTHPQPFLASEQVTVRFLLPVLREGLPARFDRAPRVAHAWRATLSRAPPSFS